MVRLKGILNDHPNTYVHIGLHRPLTLKAVRATAGDRRWRVARGASRSREAARGCGAQSHARAVAHTPFPYQARRQASVVEALDRAQGLPRPILDARKLALDPVEANALETCSEQAVFLRRGLRGLRQNYVETTSAKEKPFSPLQ